MVDVERVEAICDGLIARKLDVTWATEGSALTATPRLFRRMKEAGCNGIYFGMESASEDILKYYRKPIRPEQAVAAAAAAQEAGIPIVVGSFILGAPGETEEDFRRTVRFATRNVAIDFPMMSTLGVTPGDRIWEDLRKDGTIVNEDDFDWEELYTIADLREDAPGADVVGRWIWRGYRHFLLNPLRWARAIRKFVANRSSRLVLRELLRCTPVRTE